MPGSMGGVGATPPVPPPLPPPPPPLPRGGPTTGGAFFGGAGATACGGFSLWASGTCCTGGTGLVALAPSMKEVNFTRCLDPFRLMKPT